MTSHPRPESRPVLFSGGPSGVGRLYFSSGPVRSVVAHSLRAHSDFDCSCTSLHDCIVSMQALFLTGSFHFTLYKVRPPTEPISMLDHGIANTGSASCMSGVDVHVYFAIRSAPFPTVAALRPSEGPQRSALVMAINPCLPATNPACEFAGRARDGCEGSHQRQVLSLLST